MPERGLTTQELRDQITAFNFYAEMVGLDKEELKEKLDLELALNKRMLVTEVTNIRQKWLEKRGKC